MESQSCYDECFNLPAAERIRLETAKCAGDEALIKNYQHLSRCGTDIHAWGGNQPFFSYPRVLGHEICGEILGWVRGFFADLKNGQRLCCDPYVACQQYQACKSRHTDCCEKIQVIGVVDGGFSEYLSVPVANILPADGIDPQAAALIEPLAMALSAVRRAAIAPGEGVLVDEGRGQSVWARRQSLKRCGAGGGGGYRPARREHVATRLWSCPCWTRQPKIFDARL